MEACTAAIGHHFGQEVAGEEVGDSFPDVIPSLHSSSCAGPDRPPLLAFQHTSPISPPLNSSSSSSALSKLSASEEEVQPSTPPSYSPALQASVAAWQSATILLQELQYLQQQPSLPCQMLLEEATQQQAAWLHAVLAQQGGGDGGEACSPERHLPAASDAVTNMALHP